MSSGEMHRHHELKGMFRVASIVLSPVVKLLTRPHWSGQEHLPTDKGFIVAPNHLSLFDPVYIAYCAGDSGIGILYLAKAELFKVPILGGILDRWGMVPVARGTDQATDALANARKAIQDGHPLGIYSEGTLTKSPDFWPMKSKTGIARLALDTKAPVIPVVQWGTQDILERNWMRPRGHKTDVYVKFLPALDLSDLEADSSDREAVGEVVRRLELALTSGVAVLRDQIPPATPWVREDHENPGKKGFKNFSKWRRQLAKTNKRQDILPATPSLERREVTGISNWYQAK